MFPESGRRDAATILAAHRIDPRRRELYVEGTDDRHFISWLLGSEKDPDATIREIASVRMEAPGGERGRALQFAQIALAEGVEHIRVLVDSDHDRLLGRDIPPNCWRTDLRDLEAYFFRTECIEKLWMLALGSEVDADEILNAVLAAARPIGLLRLISENEDLRLPFQATTLSKRVTATKSGVVLDIEALTRALLQNANASLVHLQSLVRKAEALDREDSQPACDVPHGHDCMALLGEILHAHGVDRTESHRLLRLTFERWMVDEHSTLGEVVAWLAPTAA